MENILKSPSRFSKILNYLLVSTLIATSSCSSISTKRQVASTEISTTELYKRYIVDTLNSLNKMRGISGLVKDKVQIESRNGETKVITLNSATSPTNIGLDIIILTEVITNPHLKNLAPEASIHLKKVMKTLSKMELYEKGLFFGWYDADTAKPTFKDVSSVDNIHLALAIWVVAKTFPDSEEGQLASALFKKLDFSTFYIDDQKASPGNIGMMAGNISSSPKVGCVQGLQPKGWCLEENWSYSNLGAEARSIYSLSWALGLFRKRDQNKKSIDKEMALVFKKAQLETTDWQRGKLLKTWDGGAFQTLLPKVLLSEERYSPELKTAFNNFASYVIEEGQRQNFPVPAAHSACNFSGVERDGTPTLSFSEYGLSGDYNGSAGSPALVSAMNDHFTHRNPPHDLQDIWDAVYTPHAGFLAATAAPDLFKESFLKAEQLKSVDGPLYLPGYGWMDGYHVKEKYRGRVVPVQLSLDQGMLAMSLLEYLSADGMIASGRALWKDNKAKKTLADFYKRFDEKMNQQ